MRRMIVSITLLVGLIWSLAGARLQPEPTQDLSVRERLAKPVSSEARQFLAERAEQGRVKVWVFFTDKGVFDEQQLSTAKRAAGSLVTPRAQERLRKNGIEGAQVYDLPVVDDYVKAVVNLGVELRRVSRWLNAASFEVELSQLDQMASLRFVQRIQPVATYRNEHDQPGESDKQPVSTQALQAHSLDYGGSYDQLNQISIPTCHDSGYTGQGVILSVFDTGFRTTHDAFAEADSSGRILATRDYVFDDDIVDNEPEDISSAWDHGTSTWSICGGTEPGTHFGPAFGASFIVCKTEDVRSETQVEEDNWVAAMEWVDSLGTDVITSSLSYSDWYVQADYDGNTCVTTVAADIAAERGIVVCNSAGNAGPSASTLGAPADADSILTVGAVQFDGNIASFSSRGPTADGRTKPEVCARGVSVHRATSSSNSSFSAFGNGTSYSCPLVAGAAAVVISAQPEWTAMQVREALMMTADNAETPDNTYGWGVIDAWAAIHYFDEPECPVPGDADGNGIVNISDAVTVIAYIFGGGAAPEPLVCADADGNGEVNISDAVYLISYIFAGGPAPGSQS